MTVRFALALDRQTYQSVEFYYGLLSFNLFPVLVQVGSGEQRWLKRWVAAARAKDSAKRLCHLERQLG